MKTLMEHSTACVFIRQPELMSRVTWKVFPICLQPFGLRACHFQ